LLIGVLPAPAVAEALVGPPQVSDGDTLTIQGRQVRLVGVDAPELGQPCTRGGETWACGEEARRQLSELVASGAVECAGNETDQYGRLLAVCWAGGFELNKTLVEQGWATAYRAYSDAYVAHETRAKLARKGIWSATFDLPENYRRAQRLRSEEQPTRRSTRSAGTSQTAFSGGCVIKGNRSRRGEWIYHLPGMAYYDATRPEEIFCSEADAQAAGYRRAIVR
jgi:endonuclease YncB( thermonuclease family)